MTHALTPGQQTLGKEWYRLLLINQFSETLTLKWFTRAQAGTRMSGVLEICYLS